MVAHLVHGLADKVGDQLVLPLQIGPQLGRGQLRLEQRVGECRHIPGVWQHGLWQVYNSCLALNLRWDRDQSTHMHPGLVIKALIRRGSSYYGSPI
jgi:hypothetical protein